MLLKLLYMKITHPNIFPIFNKNKFKIFIKSSFFHIKSKKVYKRRSTAVPITAASHAWSKSKKNGVIKFEISRDNELVENLIDDLQDVDAAKLEFLLKFIEQMLPISSIISSETEADTIISQEEKIPDKAIEMAEHIIETIYEKHAGNLDNFKETVLKLSFFKDKQSIAKNILKEILHEK